MPDSQAISNQRIAIANPCHSTRLPGRFAPALDEAPMRADWTAVNRPFPSRDDRGPPAFRFILDQSFTGVVVLSGTTSQPHLPQTEAFVAEAG
jgi:hypothetical protein